MSLHELGYTATYLLLSCIQGTKPFARYYPTLPEENVIKTLVCHVKTCITTTTC